MTPDICAGIGNRAPHRTGAARADEHVGRTGLALPVTPFHFGPGLVLKGAAAPVFSWSAFAAAQVVIDCETIYYVVNGEYPIHRFFHSFLGATAAGLIATVLFLVVVHASFIAFPRLILPLTTTATA